MNGKRIKALRKQFRETTGREPDKGVRGFKDNKQAVNGVWRDAWEENGELRSLNSMIVVEPSEWRRVKKLR